MNAPTPPTTSQTRDNRGDATSQWLPQFISLRDSLLAIRAGAG